MPNEFDARPNGAFTSGAARLNRYSTLTVEAVSRAYLESSISKTTDVPKHGLFRLRPIRCNRTSPMIRPLVSFTVVNERLLPNEFRPSVGDDECPVSNDVLPDAYRQQIRHWRCPTSTKHDCRHSGRKRGHHHATHPWPGWTRWSLATIRLVLR